MNEIGAGPVIIPAFEKKKLCQKKVRKMYFTVNNQLIQKTTQNLESKWSLSLILLDFLGLAVECS